jgi:hypothetical protein
MEAHDTDLRIQERAVLREDAWRRRVDQCALALDPPGWLLAELGPVPTDPQERAVWRGAAAELDGYRRAYGLDLRHLTCWPAAAAGMVVWAGHGRAGARRWPWFGPSGRVEPFAGPRLGLLALTVREQLELAGDRPARERHEAMDAV